MGVGLSSVLPFVLPAIYFGLLPDPTTIATTVPDDEYDNESMAESPTVSYAPVPTMEVSADEDNSATAAEDEAQHKVALTKSEKLCLVKPLLIRFMLPLCECTGGS